MYATLPLLAACGEVEVEEPEYIIDADNHIVITSEYEDPLTRTLLHSSDLNQEGTSLTIYGITTASNGESESIINGLEAKFPKIENGTTDPTNGNGNTVSKVVKVVSWDIFDKNSTTPDKPVETPDWNSELDYTFYSWLQGDKYGNKTAFFTKGFSYSSAKAAGTDESGAPTDAVPATLTIGGTTGQQMLLNDEGFDFCYSDVVVRKAESEDNPIFDDSPVNMKLNHLFASFCMAAHNYTTKDIEIKSLLLFGLKDTKSATITFDEESGASVSFDNVSSSYTSTPDNELLGSAVTLSTSAPHMANIIGGSSTTDPKYILMWPQSNTELAPTGYTDNKTQPSGGTYLKITYTKDGGSDIIRYIKMPFEGNDDWAWPAGVCQNLELSFTETDVQISVTAMPWDLIEHEIKLETSIAATGKLTFSPLTKEGSTDALADGGVVTGAFTVDTPVGATWFVSVTNTDAFTVEGENGSKDPAYGTVTGGAQVFYIKPKTGVDRSKTQRTRISIALKLADGTMVNIDSQLGNVDDSGATPATKAWNIILNPIK